MEKDANTKTQEEQIKLEIQDNFQTNKEEEHKDWIRQVEGKNILVEDVNTNYKYHFFSLNFMRIIMKKQFVRKYGTRRRSKYPLIKELIGSRKEDRKISQDNPKSEAWNYTK